MEENKVRDDVPSETPVISDIDEKHRPSTSNREQRRSETTVDTGRMSFSDKSDSSEESAGHCDAPARMSLEGISPQVSLSGEEPSPKKGPRRSSMEDISKLLHNIIRKEKKIGRFTVVVEEYPEDLAEDGAEKASTSQPANDDSDAGDKASSPASGDEPMPALLEVASAPRRRFSVVLERTPDFSHPGSRRESQQILPPMLGRPRALSSSCSSSTSSSFSYSPEHQHSKTSSQQSSACEEDVDCSSLVDELHSIQVRLQSVHNDLHKFSNRLQMALESKTCL